MDRLSILLSIMTGAVATGVIVLTGFALGYHTLWMILTGAFLGIALAWPLSYLISRRIKRQDPNWHKTADPRIIPDPKAPEV